MGLKAFLRKSHVQTDGWAVTQILSTPVETRNNPLEYRKIKMTGTSAVTELAVKSHRLGFLYFTITYACLLQTLEET